MLKVATAPLKVTLVTVLKLTPVMTTGVPALPLVGRNVVIAGAPLMAKFPALVAVPPGVVTEIGPVTAPTGAVALIFVSELTLKFALMPLKRTAEALLNLVPLMVTVAPTAPFAGVKFAMVGGWRIAVGSSMKAL